MLGRLLSPVLLRVKLSPLTTRPSGLHRVQPSPYSGALALLRLPHGP